MIQKRRAHNKQHCAASRQRPFIAELKPRRLRPELIIGCGKHAFQSHAQVTKEIPTLKLEAICDISKNSLDKFETQYGEALRKFTSEEDLLNDNIDAVIIATPDDLHTKSLYAALKAGKHAFAEKPLATNEKDLKLLVKAIRLSKEKGLVLTSCHPRRFDHPFVWIKENSEELEKELGKVISFNFDFSYHKPSKDWKHERGLLMDHINHEIDLVNFLFSHSGFSSTKLIDEFDRYQVVGIRDDNIAFSFEGTRRLDARIYSEFVKIRYEKGEVAINAGIGSATIYNHDSKEIKRLGISRTDYWVRFKRTNENFALAIMGKSKNYLSPEDLFVNTAISIKLTAQKRWRYSSK
ncbi:MAG: Gfo/Idh/MocA family oxidoreductase [Candidatus Woesearchaeota archaeon]